MSWFRLLARSFGHAFAGIWHALLTERNFRIHAVATSIAVALGFILSIAPAEWCAILLAAGLVWAAELLNTSIERLSNAITREPHEDIRRAKDTGAGAVLAAAIFAGAVGLIVFGPKVLAWWR